MSGRDEKPSIVKINEEIFVGENVPTRRRFVSSGGYDLRENTIEYIWDYVADNVITGLLITLAFWSFIIIPWYIYLTNLNVLNVFVGFVIVIVAVIPTFFWGIWCVGITIVYFTGRFC